MITITVENDVEESEVMLAHHKGILGIGTLDYTVLRGNRKPACRNNQIREPFEASYYVRRFPPVKIGQVWIGTSPAVRGRTIRITAVGDERIDYEVLTSTNGRKRAYQAPHSGIQVVSLVTCYKRLSDTKDRDARTD